MHRFANLRRSLSRSERRPNQAKKRRAVAVVELAICLPLLIMLLLATIEACVMLQLQQNVAVTAYEGARIGIIPGANAGALRMQCEMLLEDRSISAYSINTTPSDLSSLEEGDPLTVTVEVDCAANSVVGGAFFQGKTISESVVMKAE